MTCLQCGRENGADAAFCDECGARLEALCPACGESNRPGAKFCRRCGESLVSAHSPTRIVPAPRLRAPETYTPRHLAEKILTSKGALEGERKQVTVLFADLKGARHRPVPLSRPLSGDVVRRQYPCGSSPGSASGDGGPCTKR
jgi:hypothetical protein